MSCWWRGIADLDHALRCVNRWPLRALRVGMTQSNMSTPRSHRRDEVRRACPRPSGSAAGRPAGQRLERVEHGVALLGRLADGEPADGVAVEADLAQRLERLAAAAPQVHAALDDAEQRARGRRARANAVAAARAPSASRAPWTRAPRASVAGYGGHSSKTMTMSEPSVRCTSIEISGVRNTGSPFDGRAEAHALLGDLAQLGEAEHLEAARVGEDRAAASA